MTRLWLVLALAGLTACGDGDGGAGTDADAAAGGQVDAAGSPVDAAAGADGAPACPGTPIECATWIEDYQRHIVGSLAGEREIAEGVTLPERSNPAQRAVAREFIRDELAALGLDVGFHDYGTGANVVAELPSTPPGAPVIVMGAHYDSVPSAPGAADDATGVALVLTAARFLSEQDTRHHTLVFALFDQEEIGLVGSEAYAAKLAADAIDVQAVHIYDMISWDSDEDGAVELWSPAPELQSLYEDVAEDAGIPVRVHTFRFSDHASFIDEGFAAVGVSEEFVSDDYTPHYHQPTDTYDKIDFAFLGSITRLVLAVIPASPVAP